MPTSTPTFISTFSLPTVNSTSWLGTANGGLNTDWYTAANWSKDVPTIPLEAILPTGPTPYPIISSSSTVAQNLTIGSTASLTQGGGTLDVLSAIGQQRPHQCYGRHGSAERHCGAGRGRQWQHQFWNLTGASQTGALSVHGVLALASGGLRTNRQSLTLLSDVLGTALVGQSASNVVTGPVTVQRYLDASGNSGTTGYRHYSAPVSNATVASLSTTARGGNFSPVVNSLHNTAITTTSVTPYPSVYSYDQSRLANALVGTNLSDFDKGYASPVNVTAPLTVSQSYTGQIGNAEKVQFTGSLNNGDLTIGGLLRGAGRRLVGNLYPVPLDWGSVSGSQLTDVDAAVYIFQSTLAYQGRYTSFTNNVGAGNGQRADCDWPSLLCARQHHQQHR